MRTGAPFIGCQWRLRWGFATAEGRWRAEDPAPTFEGYPERARFAA